MKIIKNKMRAFIRDEAGSPAVEYAIIGSVIGIVLIVSLNEIGSGLVDLFTGFDAALIPN